MPDINLTTVEQVGAAGDKLQALHTHNVCKVKIRGKEGVTWILKEIKNPALAKLELLAQEFFRLIIPQQPRTLLTTPELTGIQYILSEEVMGYQNLPQGVPEKFSNGQYSGLGEVLACSLFLQETDLKNGNVGLNNRGRVIKIDGDLSFGELQGSTHQHLSSKLFKITPEAIASLPMPKDYFAYNWLDLIGGGVIQTQSCIVHPDLTNAPQFRAEINQAMLKICLLPDSFIADFVDAYIPAGGERFIELITNRRKELLSSALENDSFKQYLNSNQAISTAEIILVEMKRFESAETLIVTPDNHRDLEKAFGQRLSEIFPLASDCRSIVDNLKAYLPPTDPSINNAIQAIADNEHDLTKLLALKIQLTTYYLQEQNKNLLRQKESAKKAHAENIISIYYEKITRLPIDFSHATTPQLVKAQQEKLLQQLSDITGNNELFTANQDLGITTQHPRIMQAIEDKKQAINLTATEQIKQQHLQAEQLQAQEKENLRQETLNIKKEKAKKTIENYCQNIAALPIDFSYVTTLNLLKKEQEKLLQQLNDIIETPELLKANQDLGIKIQDPTIIESFYKKEEAINIAAKKQKKQLQREQAQPHPRFTTDTVSKIDATLQTLSNKIGKIDQHQFPEAMKTALKLRKNLSLARNTYLNTLNHLNLSADTFLTDKALAIQTFKTDCKQAIDQAKPVLERDLGWGAYLKNLLKTLANAIVFTISIGQAPSFFSLKKPASLSAVSDAEKDLDLLNQQRPG